MTFLTIFMRKSVKLKLRYVKNYIILNQKKKRRASHARNHKSEFTRKKQTDRLQNSKENSILNLICKIQKPRSTRERVTEQTQALAASLRQPLTRWSPP